METKTEKQFFIILGRSGSGKGTQALLLKKVLEEKGKEEVIHITTGGTFRDFIQSDNFVANLARKVKDEGGLQPEFLAVWNWSNIFITTFKGDETVILDGAPRKPFEVSVLHSAINFLGYKKPIVIYLDVTESRAREHVATRGRDDDKDESNVTNRMSWFETDVIPTLDVYLGDPRYTVLHVNGNQSIDEVQKEIMSKLGDLN